MKKLIAVDGNSLMYRAYYALPNMQTKNGTYTGAVYGFISMLIKLFEREPDFLLVAFDTHAPTFRHKQYDEYKAGRRKTPDELIAQFPILKDVLIAMGIATCECEGYEADDILGTIARMAVEADVHSLLVTSDRDALQLIDDKTHVLMTKKGISDVVEFDEATLLEQYQITPAQVVEMKGLMGDNSDNIPGIIGVGEVTALKLLKKYGSMEEALIRGVAEEKGALRNKIEKYSDSARMSYKLGIIETHAPINVTLEDCIFAVDGVRNAVPMMSSLEMKSLIARLPGSSSAISHGTSSEKSISVSVKTIMVSDLDSLSQIVDKTLSQAQLAAIDMSEENFMTFAISETEQYKVVFNNSLLEEGLNYDDVLERLAPFFSSDTKKITFDAKHLMHTLLYNHIELKGLHFDAMIADYLLNAVRPSTTPGELASEYAGHEHEGAATFLKLYKIMSDELEAQELSELYRNVEHPLISVLFDMERTGFSVDTKMLVELGGKLGDRIHNLKVEILELAGEEFNIQSPKQTGAILFGKLRLPPKHKTAQGFSTNAEVLDSLMDLHPIVPLIVEYRFLSKLKSTFVDALLHQVNPETGRIHTTLNQNTTVTGRISSTEPNLQNIPVRTELGREIRRAFVASEGNKLVDGDYSQIELRVLAHMSEDAAMVNAFNKGGDIHTQTASEVFRVPLKSVASHERSAAKAVNFGIVYGISDFGLSKNLKISRRQAAEYIELYFERYPGIARYMQHSLEDAKKRGYAKTLLGRKRVINELKSSNHNIRSFGERVARNMPIQGTAADIIKLAMIRVHSALSENGLKARLVLQIHDELIIDTPANETQRVEKLLRECMSGVMELTVPLTVDVNVGNSWYDTK